MATFVTKSLGTFPLGTHFEVETIKREYVRVGNDAGVPPLSFQSSLRVGDWSESVRYRARELQLQDFSEQGLFLNDLLEFGLRGSISDNWFLATPGTYQIRDVKMTMTRSVGVTLDCKD